MNIISYIEVVWEGWLLPDEAYSKNHTANDDEKDDRYHSSDYHYYHTNTVFLGTLAFLIYQTCNISFEIFTGIRNYTQHCLDEGKYS